MKKYLVLFSGFIIQICLGSVYAWSVIGGALRTELGLFSGETELIYGLSIGVFALGTIGTGRLVYRFGPRLMTLLSGLLFTLAFTVAALSEGNFVLLMLGLGFLMGAAIAFGYVCPLSTAVAWFPHRKGLVTGIAVMGFGGGSVLSGTLIDALLKVGHPILSILQIFGPVTGLIIALGAMLISMPEKHPNSAAVPTILKHEKPFFKTGIFWTLALSMFIATIGGLIIIGKITSLASEFGLGAWGSTALALLAFGNAGGRLFWGSLMDRFGSRAIFLAFLIMSAGFAVLTLGQGSPGLFLLGTFLTGLQFGSSFVLFATFTEKYYGAGAIGRVYPYIFACYGLAALTGPWLGGMLHDYLGSYQVLLIVLSLLPLFGFLLNWVGLRNIKGSSKNSG